MPFPVEIYCACGEKANYVFVTKGAYDEFKAMWAREHDKPGCEQVLKSDYLLIMAKVRNA